MIGIDSNILLRVVLDDDTAQSPLARDRLREAYSRGEAVLVRDVVLAEFAWVLGKIYRFGAAQILVALRSLLTGRGLWFEDEDAVAEAINLAEQHRLDFADALIAVRNRRDGCSSTLSFDRRAARMAEVTLVRA